MSQQFPQYGNPPYNPNQPPNNRHTVRNVLLALIGAFVLLVGGCTALVVTITTSGDDTTKHAAQPGSSTAPATSGTTSAPVSTPTEQPPTAEETTPPSEEPSVAKVGTTEWFTYDDGLEVQVTKLARYKAGEATATGRPGDPAVVVTVTIRNGTKQTADLSMTTIEVTYGANGNQAEEIFDENYGEGFTGSATPGRAKTAKFAFLVPKGRQVLDIEVEPGSLDYESVHFEGSVK